MYGGVAAAECWGVHPGSRPQASQQLACRSQQPLPQEQPLTQDEQLPGHLAGYRAGYDAAYQAGWEQGYHTGNIDTIQMQEEAQDQGDQNNRRGASPDWWEEDDHGDCDGGDN